MISKKMFPIYLYLIYGLMVLSLIIYLSLPTSQRTVLSTKSCEGIARIIYSDLAGDHQMCVSLVSHSEEENQLIHLKSPLFGVTKVCAGDRAVEAEFASYELPSHMRPHVGLAMVTMGVRPHQCRLVSESTVLKQRQMTVTSVDVSPSYRGKGPFLSQPLMRRTSCRAPSLTLTSSSQGTICFQGPGTQSVTIKDVTSLATNRPVLVGCDRFSDGAYEGMGVEVEKKDGARIQVADLLPGFQPAVTICHITQWSAV